MRKPSASRSDFSRIIGKLQSCVKGLEKINNNLFIYTPVVLPFPSSFWARKLNVLILRLSLWYFRKKLKMNAFQLWSFIPTMAELSGKMGEQALVYYCVDEWSKFTFMDSSAMRSMEIDLLQKADIVFVTADHLYRDKVQFNKNTYLIEHGVDHDHFSKALSKSFPVPDDIRKIKNPILGFFGLIHEWIDIDLIERIAHLRPEWSIVMIGKISIDVSRLQECENVHFLGQKPYDCLPSYCQYFDIGLIPFVINELTLNVNPIKLREYLSAGLPVVSTPLPEVEKYSDIVRIAHSPEEMIAEVEYILKNNTKESAQNRSSRMEKETWQAKAEQISSCIEPVIKLKNPLTA